LSSEEPVPLSSPRERRRPPTLPTGVVISDERLVCSVDMSDGDDDRW
jgi:hypothetical protein